MVKNTPRQLAYDALSREIKSARERAKLTQVELGDLLHRSQRAVSYVELGKTRLDFVQILELCEVCGIDIVGFSRRMKRAWETIRMDAKTPFAVRPRRAATRRGPLESKVR